MSFLLILWQPSADKILFHILLNFIYIIQIRLTGLSIKYVKEKMSTLQLKYAH